MNERVLQVGVKVILKNPAGKFLLVRRNAKKYPEVGAQWDIVGGRIKPGISLYENLQREVQEETQLHLADTPKLVAAQDILKNDRHVVRLTYTAAIKGEPVLNDEHDQYGWFSFDELRTVSPLDPYFTELLERGSLTDMSF